MATGYFNDARAFRDFLDTKLSDGADALSLDEALGLWEFETAPAEDQTESARAIKDALDDMRAGDLGRSSAEVVEAIRRKHGLLQ